ncbi:MAG: hypothetical protein KF722_02100 [Nitrospira sp.]|nr:hypothetical protein [Nitrospira sp.]
MILLWGLPEDDPLEAVFRVLQRSGAPAILVDQYEVLNSSLRLRVAKEVEGVLRVGSQEVRLEQISAAYIRPYDSTTLLRGRAADPRSSAYRHALEFDACLRAWCEVTPAYVVNPMRAMAGNNSKPFQSAQIQSMGFRIPETLVTTDPRTARTFWEHHGKVVYKSLSGVRSIVSRLSPAHMRRLGDIAWCPTQFQQYVSGTDVRVHLVGDRLFACEILSDADDYRYAGRQGLPVQMRSCDLPSDCANRCLELCQAMDLVVAGVDLRRTPDDQWYCFEVNPSPGFTYFQTHTGQAIDQAIAELLLRAPTPVGYCT